MSTPSSPQPAVENTPSILRIAGIVAALIGFIGLAGWVGNVPVFRSVVPNAVMMKGNTALGVLLAGIVVFHLAGNVGPTARRWLNAASLVVAAIGILTLAQYFFGWDLGIDRWALPESENFSNRPPGRMSPGTAFCFVLIGTGLWLGLRARRHPHHDAILSALGTTILVISGLALLGYLSELAFGLRFWNQAGMALHSAAACFALGIAFFVQGRAGQHARWALQRPVTTGFALAVALMLLVASVSFTLTERLLASSRAIAHTQEVLRRSHEIGARIAALESNQRGYIITGEESLLARVERNRRALRENLREFTRLVEGDERHREHLDRLGTLVAQRVAFSDRAIATHRAQGFQAAARLVGTGQGMALHDQINNVLAAVRAREYAVLAHQQDAAETASTTTFLFLPLGMFLSLTILSLGIFLLNQGVGERVRTESAMHASEVRFQTVIENLTEGLIISDLNGQLLHWNRASLAMHDYQSPEEGRQALANFTQTHELAELDGRVLSFDEWPLSRIFRGETVANLELRVRRRDIAWERVFSYGGALVRGPSGEQLAFLTVTDVSKRKKTEDALRARDVAEASNRVKTEFLASMSHELRTPLNGIIGFAELLVDERPGPLNPKQRHFAIQVLNSGHHLLQLINEVLDLSKVEAGRMELFPERFSVAAVLKEVCASVGSLVDQKHILLHTEVSPACGEAVLDRKKFKQILYNLLSNAVKFTPREGRIEVTVESHGEGLRLRVRDSGIGIPAAQLAKLFTPFQQIDSAEGRQQQGTGLGLVLTRKLAELHGGSIAVESAPGRGTEFVVTLPFSTPHPAS